MIALVELHNFGGWCPNYFSLPPLAGKTALLICCEAYARYSKYNPSLNHAAARDILQLRPEAAADDAWLSWLSTSAKVPGHTALMWAVELDDLDLVLLTLRLPGIDIQSRREDGKKARELSK